MEKSAEGSVSRCAGVVKSGASAERFSAIWSALNLPKGGLDGEQLLKLKGLLREFEDTFALSDSELGCADIVKHYIDTEGHAPIKQMPYRTPVCRRETIGKMVDQMHEHGIVKPSVSPWASPVVLAPKRDGTFCFCVDFWKDVSTPSQGRMCTPCPESLTS